MHWHQLSRVLYELTFQLHPADQLTFHILQPLDHTLRWAFSWRRAYHIWEVYPYTRSFHTMIQISCITKLWQPHCKQCCSKSCSIWSSLTVILCSATEQLELAAASPSEHDRTQSCLGWQRAGSKVLLKCLSLQWITFGSCHLVLKMKRIRKTMNSENKLFWNTVFWIHLLPSVRIPKR